MVTTRAPSDLRLPPSHRLQTLSGNRRGQYSIRNCDRWRVCVRWTHEGSTEIEITDYRQDVDHDRHCSDPPGGHPAETLGELGISQHRLANVIDVSPQSISEIVSCRHAVTADMALRIGRALGMTAASRLAWQRLYDPDRARATIDVSRIDPLVATGGG